MIKQKKPQNSEELGYFLAGLIDADGHINKKELAITFHTNDLSVAYNLKKVIGYGSIRKLKNTRAYNFEIYSKKGLSQVVELINNKLRLPLRINQFNTHLVPKIGCKATKQDLSCLLNNHWLAGFIQGNGSFQIKLLKIKTKLGLRVQLSMQISLKTSLLLIAIQNDFGGYIGFRKPHNTYYYSSGSFVNAGKFIEYLNVYQVMGAKFKGYRLWKKAFEQVQNKTHLTYQGLETIKQLKLLLSSVKK
jgi:LAGLIDADG endonuclease/LAGLIDADG-like domain